SQRDGVCQGCCGSRDRRDRGGGGGPPSATRVTAAPLKDTGRTGIERRSLGLRKGRGQAPSRPGGRCKVNPSSAASQLMACQVATLTTSTIRITALKRVFCRTKYSMKPPTLTTPSTCRSPTGGRVLFTPV